MKKVKNFVILICYISTLSISAQEITNGGFEYWDDFTWTVNPTGWETNNSQVSTSVEPDSLAFSGELAMRVFPFNFGTVSEGIAHTTVPLEAIPEALNFYAKWEKTESCYASVSITFFNEEISFYTETWIVDSNESEWAYVSLPLNQIEPFMTHAVIKVEVIVGDLVPGDGWLSIDDIDFGEANGLDEIDNKLFGISPNPSSNQINLNYDYGRLNDSQVSIFDIEGRLVYHNRISRTIDISSLDNGNYIVQVIHGDQVAKKQITVIN